MRVFLKPGALYVSGRPAIVSTILGSCIAVTMFSQRLKAGGICHALLPKNMAPDELNRFRYVDSAMAYMLEQFRLMGIESREMEVKLLGGADVLDQRGDGKSSIGRQNIEAALDIMKHERIRPMVSDVGGEQGRKIHFFTHTGRVLLTRINRLSAADKRRPREPVE